jgi:hypothetical protein
MQHVNMLHQKYYSYQWRTEGGGFHPHPPEIPKFWQSWAEIVLRKFYYMKLNFLYQITAASRTPD